MNSGIDQLRKAVNLFDGCNESFNQRFSAVELVQLHHMYTLCGWDIPPDEWAPRQVESALLGVVPEWDAATMEPVFL